MSPGAGGVVVDAAADWGSVSKAAACSPPGELVCSSREGGRGRTVIQGSSQLLVMCRVKIFNTRTHPTCKHIRQSTSQTRPQTSNYMQYSSTMFRIETKTKSSSNDDKGACVCVFEREGEKGEKRWKVDYCIQCFFKL